MVFRNIDKEKMSIKYIDLFAGVGGFHYGIDCAY
jgi:site-specific DNA-cytosine methylase